MGPPSRRAPGGRSRRARESREATETDEGAGLRPASPHPLLWSEKHRPQALDGIVGQGPAVGFLKRIAREGDLPHLILYGPPGVGKHSSALALARELCGESWRGSVSLLDLSGRPDLEPLARDAGSRPVGRPFRLAVLEGCDRMDPKAQQGLRRTLERLAPSSRFLLLTSRPGRLVPALRSRCLPVAFRPLSDPDLDSLVERIARAEGVRFAGRALQVLRFRARGSGERALLLLQAAHLASGGKPVGEGEALRAATAWEANLRHPKEGLLEARSSLDRLLARGASPEEILREMSERAMASVLSEEEKARRMVALAEIDARVRQGLRSRTQLLEA